MVRGAPCAVLRGLLGRPSSAAPPQTRPGFRQAPLRLVIMQCPCAGAFQHDRRIRLYETDRGWRLRKDVHCRNLRWTVTDTCLSPDQHFLLYASITPTVHMASAS